MAWLLVLLLVCMWVIGEIQSKCYGKYNKHWLSLTEAWQASVLECERRYISSLTLRVFIRYDVQLLTILLEIVDMKIEVNYSVWITFNNVFNKN